MVAVLYSHTFSFNISSVRTISFVNTVTRLITSTRNFVSEGELLVDFLFCNSSFFLLPGLTLKGDEDGCGCVVKSVLRGGAVGLDGRIGVGDHLVAVNDESMIGLSGHRARCSSKQLTFAGSCPLPLHSPALRTPPFPKKNRGIFTNRGRQR